MKAQTVEIKQNQTVEQFLTEKMKGSTGGTINLEEVDKATGLSRNETVKQIREFAKKVGNQACYIPGRRGRFSRWLFGTAKAEYDKLPHYSPKPQNRPIEAPVSSNGYKLAVTIGNETTEIPIKLELVH